MATSFGMYKAIWKFVWSFPQIVLFAAPKKKCRTLTFNFSARRKYAQLDFFLS